MAKANVIDTQTLKQAQALFSEISQSASSIDTLIKTSAGNASPESLDNILSIVQTLVNRVGWLGDLGSQKLTGMASFKGDAELWMVNPSYEDALDADIAAKATVQKTPWDGHKAAAAH